MKRPKNEKFNPEKSPKTMAYVLERDNVNIRCNRCGRPVLKTDIGGGYKYQCMNCDEDLYAVETHKGKDHTTEELNDLLLDTETCLCLDINV